MATGDMATGNVSMLRLMLMLMLVVFLVSVDADEEDRSERFMCPEGWMLKLQSCYKLGSTQLRYSKARSECDQLGSRLRVITNKDENRLFRDMDNVRGAQWLGILRTYDGKWMYRPVPTAELKSLPYTQFEDNARFNPGLGVTCPVWKSQTKKWSIERCRNPQLFFCQKPSEKEKAEVSL
ncbi:perlucin-like [Haliotis asinina]|uniref:perlucin-like n=1 Tax=Haliotis asinina TaxID=109174 RepID=UPI00353244B6